MKTNTFEDTLESFAQWREQLIRGIEMYRAWREKYGLSEIGTNNSLSSVMQDLMADRITLAFVAEFSRGKTELINALFFSDTGVRLLPSTPGRTTMCPTELYYDDYEGSFIRLLDIESRLDEVSVAQLKQQPDRWTRIDLDCESPKQMQSAFKELLAVKKVHKDEAIKLGLYDEQEAAKWGRDDPDNVEIPRWRHALISFPHSLFKKGLTILDTPGLNALGSEPELTLSLLPNAQAIVFVIAADTGVTKSDLDIWCTHTSKTSKQGLAVVLNKIDTMWGDILSSDDEYLDALDTQVQSAATILNLKPSNIFPVSAKQALMAKVQGDEELLQKSGIGAIETYLSHDILEQRRRILMEIILREIGFFLKDSINLTENNYAHAFKQHDEFKQLDFENREMIYRLIEDTQVQQQNYAANYAQLKKSRVAFDVKFKELLKALSRSKIDPLLKLSKTEMTRSISTFGMKQIMRKLFEDLNNLLQESVELTKETHMLVNDIHYQFHEKFGFKSIEPELFSISQHQKELERLFTEFETYRQSLEVTLTEQSLVVKKLYSTLIQEVRRVLGNANKEAATWGRNAMMPLMNQMLEYKKQIENRLAILKSLMQSKDSHEENLLRLEQELDYINSQRSELNEIVKIFQIDTSRSENSIGHS
jgi:hypothetical protein